MHREIHELTNRPSGGVQAWRMCTFIMRSSLYLYIVCSLSVVGSSSLLSDEILLFGLNILFRYSVDRKGLETAKNTTLPSPDIAFSFGRWKSNVQLLFPSFSKYNLSHPLYVIHSIYLLSIYILYIYLLSLSSLSVSPLYIITMCPSVKSLLRQCYSMFNKWRLI